MINIGTQNALILIGAVTMILAVVTVVIRHQLGSDNASR